MMRIALVSSLILFGSVAAADRGDPWIGIEMAPGAHGGVAVKSVVEGSPGEEAKLVSGDEVMSVDGERVDRPERLLQRVRGAKVGAHLKLLVAGVGGDRTVDVLLTARPEAADLQRHALTGRPAPDFAPSVQAGARIAKLSALRGQVVLLDFFATWCGPCVEALPRVEKLYETLGGRGLAILGISSESPSVVAAAAGKYKLRYTLASDEDEALTARYHVFGLPTMIVLDRRGVVREIAISDVNAAEKAVRELLGEK